MPKAKSRKQKTKEKDFQKVKLKVGKKKPESLNSTDTSFKAASIFIPTQLEENSEPTNRKKQTLKDLLSQSGHYNAHVRAEALEGLLDLMQSHPTLLANSISDILNKVLARLVDNDNTTRQRTLACLEYVLRCTNENDLEPFFQLIVAHLCCAMTHINDDVQIGSIEFLNSCLMYQRKLLVRHCNKLLDNFVDLIAKDQSSTKNKSVNQKSKFKKSNLLLDPGTRRSTLNVRCKVLDHFYRIVIELYVNMTAQHEHSISQNVVHQTDRFGNVINDGKYLLVDRQSYNRHKELNGYLSTPINNTEQETKLITSSDYWKNLSEKLLPILLESWKECSPAELSTALMTGSNASLDSIACLTIIAKLLTTILDILMLFNDSKETVYEEMLLKGLSNTVFTFFPFESVSSTGKSKKNKDVDVKQLLNTLNMSLSSLFCATYSKKSSQTVLKSHAKMFKGMVIYFSSTLDNDHHLLLADTTVSLCWIKDVINAISILDHSNGYSQMGSVTKSILSLIANPRCPRQFQLDLLSVARVSIIENQTLIGYARSNNGLKETLTNLISLLIDLLDKPKLSHLTDEIVAILKQCLIQNLPVSNLEKIIVFYVEHLKDSAIAWKDDALNPLDIVYFLPSIPIPVFKSLAHVCCKDGVALKSKQKIIDLVTYVCKENATNVEVFSNFLSFIFTIVLGSSTETILHNERTIERRINPDSNMTEDDDIYGVGEDGKILDSLKHQEQLVQTCVANVGICLGPSFDFTAFVEPIETVLTKKECFQLRNIFGLLCFMEKMSKSCQLAGKTWISEAVVSFTVLCGLLLTSSKYITVAQLLLDDLPDSKRFSYEILLKLIGSDRELFIQFLSSNSLKIEDKSASDRSFGELLFTMLTCETIQALCSSDRVCSDSFRSFFDKVMRLTGVKEDLVFSSELCLTAREVGIFIQSC